MPDDAKAPIKSDTNERKSYSKSKPALYMYTKTSVH